MISDTTTSIRYVVTDGVLSYGIPFRIYAPADVAVFWSVDARADTELTLGTHYTVTILTEGGMVNLLPGVVPVGAVLAVVSNIPATQEADFSSTSTVNTAALETQLDRQVQMIQQLEDQVSRAVVLPATSSETPQDVVQDIYTARDDAEAAAAAAATSEAAAASSATSAAAHALLAEQSRGQACQCADRAEQARDVAMQQAETINVVMATEMGKINTAIAINKDDQAAAITASRAWSETDEDVPVDTDEQGNPEYSSKHWAMKSAQLLAGNASTTHKGVMQVGSGLDVDEGVVSASVATTTSRGIGRVSTRADMEPDAIIENGPAFLAAGDVVPVIEEWRFVVGEFYYFRHPTLKPGFAPLQGGVISGVYQGRDITEYPIWAYLQTAEGQLLLKTEAEWQAMTTAIWHTNADGTTVGWDGIGGAPYYVQDLGAGTLRMPDVRGMYAEAAGFDSLGVGDVQGDAMRNFKGTHGLVPHYYASDATGAFTVAYASNGGNGGNGSSYQVNFDPSRVVPTGAANAPRRWGALACCYLGAPR